MHNTPRSARQCDSRDKLIHALRLEFWTKEEIAKAIGTSQETVNLVVREMADLPKLDKTSQAAASHAVDDAIENFRG